MTFKALESQIEAHREYKRSQGYLTQALSSVWSGDESSLKQLEELKQRLEASSANGGAQATARMQEEVRRAIEKDREAVKLDAEIAHYGSGFLKTAALFMRGRIGLAGTIAIYGLDQIRPQDSAGTKALDFTLGAAKGGLLKGAFHVLGQKNLGIAARGVGLGVSSRVLELGLTRQSYLDAATGKYDLTKGLAATARGTLDKGALASDVIIFGVAHGLLGKADALSHGAIKRSPLLSTVFTGTTFGMSSGAFNEIQRQRAAGEDLDVGAVVARSLLQGGIDSIAALPGGVQADKGVRRRLAEQNNAWKLELNRRLAYAGENLLSSLTGPTLAIEAAGAGAGGGAAGERLPGRYQATSEEAADKGRESAAIDRSGGTGATLRESIHKRLAVAAEADRLAMWKQAISDPAEQAAALNAISRLPARDMVAAIDHALGFVDAHSLRFAVGEIPAQDLARAARLIVDKTEGAGRRELLSLLPIYKLQALPVGERAQAVKSLFDAAAALPHLDLAPLRELWSFLPEPIEDATLVLARGPIKQHLANTLEPELLARLIFGDDGATGKVGSRLAAENPQLLSEVAVRLPRLGDQAQTAQLAATLKAWQTSRSLDWTVRQALATAQRPESYLDGSFMPEVLELLFRSSGATARKQAVETLLAEASQEHSIASEPKLTLALKSAAKFTKIDPTLLQENFWGVLQHALGEARGRYDWQTYVTRELINLERAGELKSGTARIPELKMPAVDGLPDSRRDALRTTAEGALRNSALLQSLLGRGELGRLFPTVFGDHSEGGIVGRPQHQWHEFTLDRHTLKALESARSHPEFASLPEKDQTNLLWAVLLHDVGKRAGLLDPGHEAVSASMAWGVLTTLGYPKQRIQRIANLISGHRNVSFDPAASTAARVKGDQAHRDDLAVRLRHPYALKQLRILNEADIRSIDALSSLFDLEVATELDTVTRMVSDRARELSRYSLPILTTDLPRRFGLHALDGDYALMVHVSPELPGAFFEKLGAVESPEFSASVSLVTPRQRRLFNNEVKIVAIMSGPPEQISQASPESLGSGWGVGWRGHVELARRWAERQDGLPVAMKAEQELRKLGFGSGTGEFPALEEVRRRLAQYDTLSELNAVEGPESALARAHRAIEELLAPSRDGRPHTQYNEIKLNNPTVSGIGVYRRGRPVVFEGLGERSQLEALLGGAIRPSWLELNGLNSADAVVVPKAVWQEAKRRNLPVVVLDP